MLFWVGVRYEDGDGEWGAEGGGGKIESLMNGKRGIENEGCKGRAVEAWGGFRKKVGRSREVRREGESHMRCNVNGVRRTRMRGLQWRWPA